jgi:alkylated DNA repair dioxygenase AlkB
MIKIIPEKNDQHTLFKYIPNFLDYKTLKDVTTYLKKTNDWKSGTSHNGNNIKRQQKWYQMNSHYFCKEWTDRFDRWKSHDYDEVLFNLQNIVQKECNNYLTDITIPNINSILINYYKDGQDEIAYHKDNQISFGEYPTICILSIGADRTLHFQRTISNKLNRNFEQSELNCEYPLHNNSLFIMGGSAQKFWAHGIPTVNDLSNPRWSITFREYLV